MWETYKTIFAGLEDAVCQILHRFAEHSNRSAQWENSQNGMRVEAWGITRKEGTRFVSAVCFLGTLKHSRARRRPSFVTPGLFLFAERGLPHHGSWSVGQSRSICGRSLRKVDRNGRVR